MRYVLAIGLETEIYKNPRLEVFLNDRFLGMTELEDSVPLEIQQHVQHDIISSWGMEVKKPEKKHDLLIPKKWIIYEIEDSFLKNKNTLNIEFKNLQTNIMNGFMNKFDKCKIVKVIFLPKDWFDADGIQNIIKHCTERNIIIDTGGAALPGWPSAPYPVIDHPGYVENDIPPSHTPILNHDVHYEIIYDEKLDLYRIEVDNSIENSGYIHKKISEISFKDDFLYRQDYRFATKQPQDFFENNSETSVLNIDQSMKVYLKQIATKYQHNEN